MKIRTFLLALSLSTTFVARAYNHKWTGNASDAWSNAQNWTNGAVNPTENQAIRLFFPYNDYEQSTRQDIEGLAVDYLEFHGSYLTGGGPGARLSFRNTNADPATTTIYGAGLFTFDTDLELRLNHRVNVWTMLSGQPDVIAGRFNGRISGPGDLYLSGGRVEFAGNLANTYGGITVTTTDTLRLNKTGSIAIPGDLFIGVGVGGGNNPKDKVIFLQNNQLAPSAQVTINGSGWLNLDGHAQTIAGLTLTAGQVSTDLGTLTLAGNVDANPGNVDSLIEGRLALGFAPRLFNVGGSYTNEGLHISARISGDSTASLVKNGTGTLRLSGPNSYNGATIINDGVLIANGATPLGSSIGGTIINAGATLHVEQADLGAEAITVSGYGDNDLGALFVFGSSTSSGPITLASDARITVWAGNSLSLNGVISGPGGLDLVSGTVGFGGDSPNTYAGSTHVASSTLELRKRVPIIGGGIGLVAVPGALEIGPGYATARLFYDNEIGNSSAVTITGNGLLDLNGQTDTIGSLSGAGAVDLGNGEIIIGGNTNSTTTTAKISGTGGRLRKIGPATLTLVGTNTYTGITTVEAGTLVINSTQAASPITVKTNATLAGNGTVGTITTQGGIISPGDGIGVLNSKGISLNSATFFRVDLNGAVPGVNQDQLNVSGVVQLGNCKLEARCTVNLTNQAYVILNNDGADAVIGTFAGLPEGQTFFISSRPFTITYHGGDGNDVALRQLSGPAPAQLSAIRPTANGQMVISGAGYPGLSYVVEANADLNASNWVAIGNATALGDGTLAFTDADAPNFSQRFYRFVTP